MTLFERHEKTEVAIGLSPGTLTWRRPLDPFGDPLWTDMLEGKIAEREYWAARAAEVGRLKNEVGYGDVAPEVPIRTSTSAPRP